MPFEKGKRRWRMGESKEEEKRQISFHWKNFEFCGYKFAITNNPFFGLKKKKKREKKTDNRTKPQ